MRTYNKALAHYCRMRKEHRYGTRLAWISTLMNFCSTGEYLRRRISTVHSKPSSTATNTISTKAGN